MYKLQETERKLFSSVSKLGTEGRKKFGIMHGKAHIKIHKFVTECRKKL
jgi:hypothetical protein